MLVIPGIAALLTYIYVRPHEVLPALKDLTIMQVLSVAAFGYVLDLRLGVTRLRPSLFLVVGTGFFMWAFVVGAIKAPDRLGELLPVLTASLALFLFTSQGIQSFRGFAAATNVLLVITLLLAFVGIQQGASHRECIVTAPDSEASAAATALGVEQGVEGRPCETRRDCYDSDSMGSEFICERPGLLGTHSIGGRVRYLGVLQDPNELAWAVSMGLPFAFAWYERRRSLARLGGVAAAVVACVLCAIMTRSRSGQIALSALLAIYFIRRLGWRGAVVGALASLPLMVFGGRSGAEADSSRDERLECWLEALGLWRENPFLGVGTRQFSEHHYLTAHNSWMLALAEMGPVGLFLWTAAVYVAFKIAIQVQRDLAGDPEAVAARVSAFALMASLVSMVLSATFLSIAYHPGLWIQLGLAGAVQASVQRHRPDWRLRWRRADLVFIILIDVALVGGIWLYLKMKGL
jgi:hypothetical protein